LVEFFGFVLLGRFWMPNNLVKFLIRFVMPFHQFCLSQVSCTLELLYQAFRISNEYKYGLYLFFKYLDL
jgi:hypothetical protein